MFHPDGLNHLGDFRTANNPIFTQAAQTHLAREGCNVIYIKIMWRTGVALQATIENIREFVWEIIILLRSANTK